MSANPREQDQVVDPIARDSETRFDTCLGLKRPEQEYQIELTINPNLQSINLNTYFIFKALYSVVLPTLVVVYDIE